MTTDVMKPYRDEPDRVAPARKWLAENRHSQSDASGVNES
jgi:hypothetical protein